MFYHFSQNNSGGSFDFDKEKGITCHLIIEADNHHKANKKLKDLVGDIIGGSGGYCPCCGDRWYEVDERDGETEAKIYGELFSEYDSTRRSWVEGGFDACLHKADGSLEWK